MSIRNVRTKCSSHYILWTAKAIWSTHIPFTTYFRFLLQNWLGQTKFETQMIAHTIHHSCIHTFYLNEKKRILFANIAHRSYKIIMERNICVYIHEIWPIVCSSLFAFISNILILIKQNLWPQAILLFIWFLFFLFFFSFSHSHSFAEYQNEHRYLRYP